VPRYAGDPNRHLVGAVLSIAGAPAELVPDPMRSHYARFIRKTFGARARKLGWTPAAGEDEDTGLLRASLLGLVTDEGGDRALAAEAKKLALAWLERHDAVDPNLVSLVLGTAALYGDAALFERYLAAARASEERRDRQRLLRALAAFREPALVRRAHALALGDDFDVREGSILLDAGLTAPATRRLAFETVKAAYDRLAARLPKMDVAYLVYSGVDPCDPALVPEVKSFFGARTPKLPGGERVYAQAIEELELCVEKKAAQGPGLTSFLKRF
jgi:alanyl aminopeptidase